MEPLSRRRTAPEPSLLWALRTRARCGAAIPIASYPGRGRPLISRQLGQSGRGQMRPAIAQS